MLGIASIFYLFKSINFGTLFATVSFLTEVNFIFFSYELNSLFIICFFLFIGAVGKSAQLGLHV
jgi:NADH-quinone oxidoreductase subunit L